MEKKFEKSTIPSDAEAGAGATKSADELAQTAHPRGDLAAWKWALTCIVLYLGALLYGLDTTIAADVQAQAYESLGHIENLPWIGLAFPMASAAMILPLGRAYGLIDVKALVIASVCLFEIGSAICGAAPTSNALIVGRAVAGIGGAGMYLGALTYMTSFSTPQEAPIYNALTGLSWGVGCILGPVIGGAFSVSSATWRWAFYINLPLAGFILPVYIFFVPGRNPRPDLKVLPKLKEIDWIGTSLFAATVVLFMIVLTFGGSTFAWKSGGSIALWGLKIFTSEEHRIFPVHFLRSRTMVLLYVATGTAGAAQGVVLYYTPLFFQFTKGDTAIQAAISLLPFICLFIFFVLVAGGSLPLVGRYNLYHFVGGCFVLIGGALLCTIDETTSAAKIYGYEAIAASGLGLLFQIGYAVAVTKVDPKDVPRAICFINLSQIGTVAVGLAIAGTLFQNVGVHELENAFAGRGFPEDFIRSALAGGISPVFSSHDEEAIGLAVTAVTTTIRKIFSMVAAAGALGVVSSVLMRFEKLDLGFVAGG
ncbi:Major facilitator superfamily domain, general substrate transporter [Akanthomyces lecanii RCEF 1005]|uniref:Major facilitator superfamily domain, general substrate transporter n=1 Tax=Akanthomyces lecanii RCEF 1005 TaxID=1081108 RepID=A0A168BGY2_CORDF|nr:Major facilitator superfamily domain, general substrate transporter [Akanthomyces lecanii RCEF 1005]